MLKRYRINIALGFLLFITQLHSSNLYGQCLQVNVGVIIDKFANPCNGPITLDAKFPGYNYHWNNGSTSRKIVVTKSGSYIVVVDDGHGCTGTDTVEVSFLPLPVISLGPDPAPQCGGCVELNAGAGSGFDYQWSTGETTEKIKFCATGNHLVSVKVSNDLGCSVSDSIRIKITPGINVNLGADLSPCDTQTVLNSHFSNLIHVWNTGDSSESIVVKKPGEYYVDVKDTSNGCVGSDTIKVVFRTPVSFDLGPDPDMQCGGCVSLQTGLHPGLTYQWSTGETSSTIKYCTEGVTNVTVTATNSQGCSDTDTLTVNIKKGYNVPPGTQDTVVCLGPILLNAPQHPGANYLWSNGQTTPSIKVDSAGIYSVIVSNLPGCNPNDIINDTMKVSFKSSIDTPSQINDQSDCSQKKFSIDPIAGAVSYIWTVPSGCTIISGQGTPLISVVMDEFVAGNVSVYAKSSVPTCNSLPVELPVNANDHKLNIPNAFSPNEDGLNDKWVIRNIQEYPENELVVLNRWGNEVYKKANYRNEWDGSALNEGSYFFKLKIKKCNEEKILTGYITIVR